MLLLRTKNELAIFEYAVSHVIRKWPAAPGALVTSFAFTTVPCGLQVFRFGA